MEDYLLKSIACFALFYGGYWLLLRNTSKHSVKRFYLISSVLLAMIIPLITFTTYLPGSNQAIIEWTGTVAAATEAKGIDWPSILLGLYLVVSTLLLIRFIRNLFGMYSKVYKNERDPWPDHWKILLGGPTEPHTFLRYIFLNRAAYERQEIPKSVLLHEEAHARQWHTLDLILMELLQVVFWFNPLIPLFRRAIKLNHEFLADQAVIDHGIPRHTYQHTLLAFSSNAAVPTLAHGINYSSFKKRLTVMKTQTSNRQLSWRMLLLIPIVALALYGFSNKEVAYLEDYPSIELQDGATKKQIKEYNTLAKKYNEMDPQHMNIKKQDVVRMEYLYSLMTTAQRGKAQPFPQLPLPPPPPEPAPAAKLKGANKMVPPPPPPPPSADHGELQEIEIVEIAPPPPPPPPNPLDHVIDLAKEGATFYYEGKKVSSDKAIKVVKKHQYLNIQVKDCEGKPTEVHITKNPIKLP